MKSRIVNKLCIILLLSLCSCSGISGAGAGSNGGSAFSLGKAFNF